METSKHQFATIDDYIASCPQEVRDRLQVLRQAIKEVAPEAKETIKYQMPAFTYHGNLIYFAAYKNHIALYPTTAEMEAAIAEVAAYKSGKGTLQFPLDQPLPLPLIRQIVAFRMQENLARTTNQTTKK